MNINDFKGKIRSKYLSNEVPNKHSPIEDSYALYNYKLDEKTGFFRKLDDLCAIIYEFDDFQ